MTFAEATKKDIKETLINNNDISNNDIGLSIFLLNSRSFRSNFDNIIQLVTEIKYNFDFIIFTETLLTLLDIDIYFLIILISIQ